MLPNACPKPKKQPKRVASRTTVCTNLTQSGVAPLWRSGKIQTPADCPYWAHREQVHHDAMQHGAPSEGL